MNEPKNTNFFPQISEPDARLVAPEIYRPYQETDEDRRHEARLEAIEAQIKEKIGAGKDEVSGELPYDAQDDRKRWDALEKDFERVFDEAEKIDFS